MSHFLRTYFVALFLLCLSFLCPPCLSSHNGTRIGKHHHCFNLIMQNTLLRCSGRLWSRPWRLRPYTPSVMNMMTTARKVFRNVGFCIQLQFADCEAWHTGCCSGPGVVTAPTVPCIHVLKNPQRAVPSAQNGAFFNLYADVKQGLRKRSLQGSVAQPKPNIGKAAPQGAQMNEIITEGVAKRPTMANGWVRDTYTPPTVTMSQLRLQAGYAASKHSIMTSANCFH